MSGKGRIDPGPREGSAATRLARSVQRGPRMRSAHLLLLAAFLALRVAACAFSADIEHAMKDDQAKPTAIATASDVMACGFISELHRNGCEVPRDVSVIGFDDIDIAEIFIPALTTIRQPRNEIGDSAAEALLRIVQGSGEGEGGHVLKLWPPELIERESVQRVS